MDPNLLSKVQTVPMNISVEKDEGDLNPPSYNQMEKELNQGGTQGGNQQVDVQVSTKAAMQGMFKTVDMVCQFLGHAFKDHVTYTPVPDSKIDGLADMASRNEHMQKLAGTGGIDTLFLVGAIVGTFGLAFKPVKKEKKDKKGKDGMTDAQRQRARQILDQVQKTETEQVTDFAGSPVDENTITEEEMKEIRSAAEITDADIQRKRKENAQKAKQFQQEEQKVMERAASSPVRIAEED